MKKLISKNPIELFKIGKFQKGKPLNMSRLYRRSDGTYTTTDGTVVGYWKGKRLGISGLAWLYLKNKYGREYANNANANMVNGNIYQGGKWRANYEKSGNKTVDWKTATEGQNTDIFVDKRTGDKTRFNVSRNLSKPQQTTKKISNPLTKANLTPKTSSAPEKSKFLRGAEAGNYKILLNSNGNYYYDLGPYRIFANGDVYRLKTKELIDTKKGYRSEYIHRTMPLIATTRFGAKRYRDINGNIVDSDGDIVSTYEELKSNPYTVYKPKVGQITIDPEMGMAFYRNPTANSELYLNTPGLFTIYKQGGILKHQRGAKFMGTGIQKGWTSNYGNNLWNGITNDLKLALIGTGKFTEDSFKDARSLQTALNSYFAGNAATMKNRDDNTDSRIAVDNKWGDLSQKALMHALSMANYDEARPLNINNVSPINAPLNGISTIPTKAEARPEHMYNRAEVRQLLRNQGINPYSLSGALRQALRFALNGGHKYNKALLHGINLKKLTLPTTVSNTTPNSGNVQTNTKENTILIGYNPLEVANPGIITLKKSGGRLISKSPVELFRSFREGAR